MQTDCPQCSQKLVVEDDKVPAGPFMLRCPKCQKAIKLPGKGGAALPLPGAEQPVEAAPPTQSAAPGIPSSPPSTGGNARQQPKPSAPAPPPARPAAAVAPPSDFGQPTDGGDGSAKRALLALTDPSEQGLQNAVTALLQRCGYGVETATDPQQGIQLLERNSYAVVATTSNGAQGNVSPYKRIAALAPEARRDLFLILLGSDFSSGDGTQAFAAMADLVLNPKDVASAEELLRSTVNERTRLFKPLQEAVVRSDRRKY